MTRKVKIILCVFSILLAIGFTIYPLISNRYSEKSRSLIETKYTEAIEQRQQSLFCRRQRVLVQPCRRADGQIRRAHKIQMLAPHMLVIAVEDLKLVYIFVYHLVRPQKGDIVPICRPADRNNAFRREGKQRPQLTRERGVYQPERPTYLLCSGDAVAACVCCEIYHKGVGLFTVCACELLRSLEQGQMPIQRRRQDDHTPAVGSELLPLHPATLCLAQVQNAAA